MSEFSLPAEFDLGDHCDHTTLMRAQLLEPDAALLSTVIEGDTLHTTVRGGHTQIFDQRISFHHGRTGLQLKSSCTCAVGTKCAHVAAALMAFERAELRAKRQGVAHVVPRRTAAQALDADTARRADSNLPLPRLGSADDDGLPRALQAWLASWPGAEAPSDDSARAAPVKRLMYVLSARQHRPELMFHLGSLRRNGEISAHAPHGPSAADMLRSRPSYVTELDETLLAGLLPFTLSALSNERLALHGTTAAACVRALAQSGRMWWLSSGEVLARPPGLPLRWVDGERALRLAWQSPEGSTWATRWETVDEPGLPAQLLLLPEPHAVVIDSQGPSLGAVRLEGVPTDVGSLEWLSRMPEVPAEHLAELAAQMQSAALARHTVLPVPQQFARKVQEAPSLSLQPVLRLRTCAAVPMEGWLSGHQRPLPVGQSARQAAVQVVLRYELPSNSRRALAPPSAEFQFPVVGPDVAFLEVPALDDESGEGFDLLRFHRMHEREIEALEQFQRLGLFRPWSRLATFAQERVGAYREAYGAPGAASPTEGQGRVHLAPLPSGLIEGEMVFVPQDREQWPELLSRHIPALQTAGWRVETESDFPFQVFEADDFELSIDEEQVGRLDWFSVGLKVHVGGAPVDLVPLLIGLVRAGWLAQEGAGAELEGDVLLPWPDDAPSSAGGAQTGPSVMGSKRERLLRLPVARVAPLAAWLRGVFQASGAESAWAKGQARVSRYELGALESVSSGVALRTPSTLAPLLEQLKRLRTGESLPLPTVSSKVQATLRPYQLQGLAWMDFLRRAHFGGVLADDMGLGKTLQTLTLLQGEQDSQAMDRPSLVIAPTSLLGNWEAEARRFTPSLRVLVIHGPQRHLQLERIGQVDLVITSYPLAVRDMPVLAAHPWHYLIIDEAQRIKNSRSQATVAIKHLQARHRLALSGTPIENHLGELWSLMDFVSPGLLGSEAQFREHYRNPIERRQDTLQAEALARRIRPFVLRRTKSQVAQDLPEKTETLLRVELDGRQRDLYETVRATMDKKLREAIAQQGLARSQIVVLDALLKLRQVCCDPRLLKSSLPTGEDEAPSPQRHAGVASAKLELLRDLLPTLVEDGRRILLFSQFTEMLGLLEQEMKHLELPYLLLTGESNDRAGLVREFQEGSVPIFLISLKAGGVGLNLTSADTVILFDPWWNPAAEQQAIDRAYRIGQGKPVFVYKLVASGTVEEKMLELQARKAGLADALLSGVASDASLTAEDFEALFQPLVA